MQLDKLYTPQKFEIHWANWWIETGLYQARIVPGKPVFSIVIPPPNVTGQLHIGHMLDHTVADVAVRWHRMLGDNTLWLPGMDHAGIATQMVVERQLTAEGTSRRQLGRQKFECLVWQWKEQYGGRIKHQIEREGASVDWSRERFTMDEGLSRAVREVFVRLWEAGLMYRGEYMVNWCPKCGTAISDVETLHEAVEGHLWHIRYPVVGSDEGLVVATTRPETMLGDTALAVNPDDPRYWHLIGKTVLLPIMGREIPIVADAMADPKFGTGVVKITPAHDPNDFEAGKRHTLPIVKVIGEDAKMTASAGVYAGIDRFEARKRIVAALEASGELIRIEPYTVNISKCQRSNTIIEPLLSTQWFARMKPMADLAIEAVETGRMRFVPDDREVVFFQWMRNIRDWCVSRQLWWGHRIPAWYCKVCGEIIVARTTPAACPVCHSTELDQDPDVLDTWFSSSLWPFSTMGWPEETEDFKTFYPTSLLITGFDILFFWVARMMMLGIWCTGEVPFREVHMHGLVRDAERQKMSKTKGNVVDPLELIEKYGTDACRIGLLVSAAPGADIALKEDRLAAARSFANKLWNASRLLFMNMERSHVAFSADLAAGPDFSSLAAGGASRTEDVWIFNRFSDCCATVNRALAIHRYHEVAQTLWDFLWHEFCDWYLEVKKLRFTENSGLTTDWRAALYIYEQSLRLLHPFMPFLTEELWQRLIHDQKDGSNDALPISVSLASFPQRHDLPENAKALQTFSMLQQVITAARELRADHKLDPKATFPADLYLHEGVFNSEDLSVISTISRLDLRQHTAARPPAGGLLRSTSEFDLRVEAQAPEAVNGAGTSESRARIEKELASIDKVIENSRRQLTDETFLSKAPPKVVETIKSKLADYELQRKKLRDQLEGLS